MPHIREVSGNILPDEMTKNAWHLHLFGVLPEYHNQGLGKKLFKFQEDQVRSSVDFSLQIHLTYRLFLGKKNLFSNRTRDRLRS
jgi:GNAT superfamily N-acetyltransferase